MAPRKKAVKKVTAVAGSTDIAACDPPLNDDVTDTLAPPDVQSETDIRKILADAEKRNKVLQGQHATLTMNLNIERSKNQALVRERASFKANTKTIANQEAVGLHLTIRTLKDNARSAEASKKELLKARDIKFNETYGLYQKNLKSHMKLVDQVTVLNKKINERVASISILNGDIAAQYREICALKKDNKALNSKIAALVKKSCDIDEKKMDHALRLKILAKETEELKVLKIEHTKILRDKTNDKEHKRKLETIEFVASTKKKGKEEDVVRKERARQGKLKIGSEQMGLLHGELRKQVASNGGTVPNPGTTPLPMVSRFRLGNHVLSKP